MPAALLIDFGSTYTKLRAVDLDAARVLATGQGPSTVASDVMIGLRFALADLERRLGERIRFAHRLASSSAAGGLRMVTIGLVKELTAEAARQAALGAGARLVGAYAYRLTKADIASIIQHEPDIVLLAGGTDGGNSEVIRHNAGIIAASRLSRPVIVAGNRDAADDIAETLAAAGKPVRVAGNVMPSFGELDIDPAREAIRAVFMERIVHAKGIDKAAAELDAVLMPTPAAVMEGARLIALGTASSAGLGELMVIDIGGATTDVHSVATGAPTQEGAVQTGLPEPFVKRTVEGDLGVRHNAATIAELAGAEAIAIRARLPPEAVAASLAAIARDLERLPATREERAFDEALAWAAVRAAVERHAGTQRIVQTAHGPVVAQSGKDLSNLEIVIGTGGPLALGATPASVLEAALADPAQPFSLRPRAPRLLIDADYVLYAGGLLASVAPEAALALMKRSLKPVSHEARP
jgi:uncharacterized protein (TIGR01319 family)